MSDLLVNTTLLSNVNDAHISIFIHSTLSSSSSEMQDNSDELTIVINDRWCKSTSLIIAFKIL